jgi:adenosylmethionine-8-amino-7-oxononanoate aminotransferase
MANTTANKYTYRQPEGMWDHVFSDHPFTPILDRAEGIYLYDTEGKRYIDVSGGPMAIGMAHNDKRITAAMAQQLGKFAYCHPVLSNEPRARVCERLGQAAPGNLNTTFLTPGGGSDKRRLKSPASIIWRAAETTRTSCLPIGTATTACL